MKNAEFNDLLMRRVEKMKAVLAAKGAEYASEKDRLHNFKRAAGFKQETPQKAAWGMAMKHLVSVADMVDEPKTPSRDYIDEKIGDAINYLVLLEALYVEEINESARVG